MDLNSLNLGTTAEVAAVVAVTGVATQLLKKKTAIKATYLPWVAFVLGAIVGVGVFAWYGDASYVNGALLGALSGGTTAGLFDGIQPVASSITTTVATKKADKAAETAQQQKKDQLIDRMLADYETSQQTPQEQAVSSAVSAAASEGGETSEAGKTE